MQNFLQKNRYALSGLAFGVIVVFVLSYIVAERRLADFQVVLEQEIQTTANEILTIATDLGKGAVSEEAERIVANCSVGERAQFDNRLSKLDQSLSNPELAELSVLFDLCASVQVRQRAITLLSLQSEVNRLNNALRWRELLGNYSDADGVGELTRRILSNEQSISAITYDQVDLQKEIITQLQSGILVTSEAASELRSEARAISDNLNSLVSETAELREELRASL
jgi:hypothetical protein